jgi:hypothetical protein
MDYNAGQLVLSVAVNRDHYESAMMKLYGQTFSTFDKNKNGAVHDFCIRRRYLSYAETTKDFVPKAVKPSICLFITFTK